IRSCRSMLAEKTKFNYVLSTAVSVQSHRTTSTWQPLITLLSSGSTCVQLSASTKSRMKKASICASTMSSTTSLTTSNWHSRACSSRSTKQWSSRSEEHTSELQSRFDLVC